MEPFWRGRGVSSGLCRFCSVQVLVWDPNTVLEHELISLQIPEETVIWWSFFIEHE